MEELYYEYSQDFNRVQMCYYMVTNSPPLIEDDDNELASLA
jgi:hypothetical protein